MYRTFEIFKMKIFIFVLLWIKIKLLNKCQSIFLYIITFKINSKIDSPKMFHEYTDFRNVTIQMIHTNYEKNL